MKSDALKWLEDNLEESLLAPDEAFDWVFMLKDSDWSLLEGLYNDKPPLWREACAYIFVNGPIKESKNILVKALSDSHRSVREQASETICFQLREYPDEVVFDHSEIKRALSVLAQAESSQEDDIQFLKEKLTIQSNGLR